MEDLVKALVRVLYDYHWGTWSWSQLVEEIERTLGRRITDEEHRAMYYVWHHGK